MTTQKDAAAIELGEEFRADAGCPVRIRVQEAGPVYRAWYTTDRASIVFAPEVVQADGTIVPGAHRIVVLAEPLAP